MLSPAEEHVATDAVPGLLSASHLAPAAIVRLSELWREPVWLRERRLAAGRVYATLPLPRWERGIRGWWTTDISGLHLERIAPYALADSRDVRGDRQLERRSRRGEQGERSGLLVQRDATVVHQELDEMLAAKGVIFTDLSRAAREYPDLLRAHLGGLVQPEEDKFVALHTALASGGVLLYVPAGVEVTLPLAAQFRLETPQTGMFVHTLLIAEAGSRVTYLEQYSSAAFDGEGLHSGVVEVYAKEGADVQFITVHNWGETVYNFALKRTVVHRDARMRWVAGFLGSGLTKAAVETRLQERGAQLEMAGIFFGSGKQHLDLTSRTYHEAPHTQGDVLFKGVVKDAARSALEGIIRVEQGAQQTTSYLSDHTLQLSREAKSDSIPSLEIEANDVRVSHGATVGMIDEEQLYYLMSRGLSRHDAERMIVGGFFEPVLKRVPLAGARQELLDCIERKMGA